jgi:UDP-GlcNAc:undecaprenyl-phosphate/decaprenyl-phosphate GlcNAc-1-phosphate transferase
MLLYPILASILAVTAMPMCIRLARRYDLLDAPDAKRKLHDSHMPFTGGYAIVVAFALTFGVMWFREGAPFFLNQYAGFAPMYLYIAEATLIIIILGIVDDLRELTYSQKFFFQFIAAFLMIFGAIKSGLFPSVFGIESSSVLLSSVGMVVSLLWLVGTTNAINMIDGLDGLAGATSLISAVALAIVSFLWGNPVLGIVLLTLAGAITGFLVFNLPPARVFMGDGGSMFIGFMLAFSGWMLVDSGPRDFTAILVPVIILGLPVSDTLLAFFRRIMLGFNPFIPDLDHIHHMLARKVCLPVQQSLLLLAGIALVYAAAGIAVAVLSPVWAWSVIAAVVVGKLLLLHVLGYTRMLRQRTALSQPSVALPDILSGKNGVNGTSASAVKLNGNGHHVNGNGVGSKHPAKKPETGKTPNSDAS